MKINRVTPAKHSFLRILDTIPTPPSQLFFTGSLPDERRPTVAIVGTRKPTNYGKEVAHQLSYDLAKHGVIIVSGLALGIDTIAHRAALEANGTTIAVLANSVEAIYPRTNQQLGEQIITQGGAIMSEYEPPTAARAYQFLARNRIVSGLSDAIIIIEAAKRSGTLATAAHALEQGRDVFVVPGNITSPLSAGCNSLLKQGAIPATCVEDILERIAPEQLRPEVRQLSLGTTPTEIAIISALKSGVRDGDELFIRSQASSLAEFQQALTMLEINGAIRALGANQWAISNYS